MGVEVIALAVTAASAVNTTVQQRKAAAAQKESGAINTASGEAENIAARRRAAREARIRRGRLRAAAQSTGTSGSSGLAGAESALQSNLGAAIAGQRTQELAARGLTAASQRVADAKSNAAIFNAWAGVAMEGLDLLKKKPEAPQ